MSDEDARPTIVEIEAARTTQSSKIDDLGVRSWKRQRISSVEASKPDSGNANERPVVVSPLYRKLKREKKERKERGGGWRRMVPGLMAIISPPFRLIASTFRFGSRHLSRPGGASRISSSSLVTSSGRPLTSLFDWPI